MYASGSSPVAAASCRTCSLARLAAPLGRPAPGRFPPCPFIVRSRLIENRGLCVPYPVHLYHNTVQRAARNDSAPPGTDDELGRVMTALCGIDVSRSRISNARRRGRDPEEMRECFGAIPATDEGFIRRLYRTRPDVLRQVLLPLLTPQSAAIRRLEEILAEEDEAELARAKVEWLERFHNAVRDDALIAEFGT